MATLDSKQPRLEETQLSEVLANVTTDLTFMVAAVQHEGRSAEWAAEFLANAFAAAAYQCSLVRGYPYDAPD